MIDDNEEIVCVKCILIISQKEKKIETNQIK
jgi:hypothetical protein